MTPRKDMNVLNFAAMGTFVAQWSNGTLPRPLTVADLRKQVPATVMELGAGYADCDPVDFIDLPAASGNLTFVIPAAEDLNSPAPDWGSSLPDFYSDLAFSGSPVSVVSPNSDDFKSSRIADYSTAKCM